MYQVFCPSTLSGKRGLREQVFGLQCYVFGPVSHPPLQGGRALASRIREYPTILKVSCPSHHSREAPPERAGFGIRSYLLKRSRALLTTPASRVSEYHTIYQVTSMYQVSCPSHTFREARPERAGFRIYNSMYPVPCRSHLSREAPP